MSDECRVSPGETLRVTLLDGYPRSLFHIRRPWAIGGCGVCGHPWSWHGHVPTPMFRIACDRCGIAMDHLCYSGRFLGLTEEERLECDDEELLVAFLDSVPDEGNFYVCSACQN
jgi:hypothetical protein